MPTKDDVTLAVRIPVAWGDMDAFQHVNNAVFLRWFETARIAWFEQVRFPEEDGKSGPVVRAATVTYELPVTYPDTVTVKVWSEKLGRTSVTLAYEVTSAAKANEVVATGTTTIVFVDRVANTPLPLPDDFRARITLAPDGQ